jgi:Uma2 family endonuclease
MSAATQSIAKQSIEYPDSDGQPIGEDTLHFDWIIRIVQWLQTHYFHDPEVFVAGDLLWYAVEGEPTIRTAPDALVAFGRPKGQRGSYKQWMEGSVAPQVVFEVLPTRDRFRETLRKWQFYQQYGVEELYIYKPDTGHFEGWIRKAGQLEEIPEIAGFVSPRLQIRFEPGEESDELKFFDLDGNRFLTFCEALYQRKAAEATLQRMQSEALAQAERARGDRYAAKLRELGFRPESA